MAVDPLHYRLSGLDFFQIEATCSQDLGGQRGEKRQLEHFLLCSRWVATFAMYLSKVKFCFQKSHHWFHSSVCIDSFALLCSVRHGLSLCSGFGSSLAEHFGKCALDSSTFQPLSLAQSLETGKRLTRHCPKVTKSTNQHPPG